jgi:citrate lyase beta subunit
VKGLGLGGKLVIHPKQIESVDSIFQPSKEEICLAKEIIDVYEKAHFMAIKHKGIMIDKPVYNQALTTLEEAWDSGRIEEMKDGKIITPHN